MMRIGIIDIGSNTARLLVATVDGVCIDRLDERRAYLGLGRAIERTGKRPGESWPRPRPWPRTTPSVQRGTTLTCSTSS